MLRSVGHINTPCSQKWVFATTLVKILLTSEHQSHICIINKLMINRLIIVISQWCSALWVTF